MPSQSHEILVDLFRKCGEMTPELLRRCADIELEHDHVEVTSIDFSQVASTEYRADAVVELRDRENATAAAVIVEVQLGVDADKPYSWPVYVTALRAKQRCPVTLLVVTEDPAVARWARKPIKLGHPAFCLEPVVLELDAVPRIIDPVYARRLPQLAVLSAMANPELEVATTAVSAIATLPDDQKRLYSDIILARLPDEIRHILEGQMKGYEYQSEFARTYYRQGHEEGLSKGREEGLSKGREEGLSRGLEEGREEGREEGLRAAVLALARGLLGELAVEDEAAIDDLHDQHALTELIGKLAQAQSRPDARAALRLAVGRS